MKSTFSDSVTVLDTILTCCCVSGTGKISFRELSPYIIPLWWSTRFLGRTLVEWDIHHGKDFKETYERLMTEDMSCDPTLLNVSYFNLPNEKKCNFEGVNSYDSLITRLVIYRNLMAAKVLCGTDAANIDFIYTPIKKARRTLVQMALSSLNMSLSHLPLHVKLVAKAILRRSPEDFDTYPSPLWRGKDCVDFYERAYMELLQKHPAEFHKFYGNDKVEIPTR